MKQLIKNLRQNKALSSITTLASGSLIAQVITILTSPITTRIFTPEELGTYTLLITAVNMFGPIICLRYDLAIVTEKTDRNSLAIFKLSVIVSVLMSLFVSFGYFIYFQMNETYHSLTYTVVILFILLLTTGLTNALTSYNNRNRQYKLMTSVYVIRTTAQNLLMVMSGMLKTGVFGLISSQVLSQLLGIKKQGEELIEHKKELKKISKNDILNVAKKYKKQLLYSTPASFANSFSYSSINLFISSLFNNTILGYYSISYRVLGLPLNIISSNVSKVFFEDASNEYHKKGSFKHSLLRTTSFLGIISVIMVIGLVLFSPLAFKIFFGPDWEQAGVFVQILAPMFGIRFIVNGVSIALIIAQRQDFELMIQALFIICSVAGYLVARFFVWSITKYLVFISISYSVIYIIFFIFIYNSSKNMENTNHE